MQNTVSPDELAAWLRLSLQPGIGPVHGHTLLQHFANPLELYQASYATLRALLPEGIATQLLQPLSARDAQYIERALHWLSKPGQTLLTPAHADYPDCLRQLPDAPLVLYARGALRRLRQDALAVVGARNASADGLDHAQAFANHLALQGFAIVSGLAHGVDAAAHRGALRAGADAGGTIAVLGTGADLIYPTAHRQLAEDILGADGLLLSEFALGSPALAAHFPKRNRIVAGLSLGVLVVEAALKSGSLITARLAVELGREVFALPGSIHSPLTRGPHSLIKQGAKLVESGADIRVELRPNAGAWLQPDKCPSDQNSQAAFDHSVRSEPCQMPTRHPRLSKRSKTDPNQTTQTDLFFSTTSLTAHLQASPCEKSAPQSPSPVWDAIGYDPVTEEQLQRRTGLRPAQLQIELFTLELGGHIERRGHGQFVRSPPR